MANQIYAKAKTNMMSGNLNLLSDDIYVALLSEGFTEHPEPTLNEIEQYTIGSPSLLTGKNVAQAAFGADDVTFADVEAGVKISSIIVYSDDTPIMFIDFGAGDLPMISTGSPITIVWNKSQNKIFKL